ncbi:hypothetical protein L1887_54949 [Cichorium endivia]|nr:hypothetical protein L1887_54949 [Cichorium endivia]
MMEVRSSLICLHKLCTAAIKVQHPLQGLGASACKYGNAPPPSRSASIGVELQRVTLDCLHRTSRSTPPRLRPPPSSQLHDLLALAWNQSHGRTLARSGAQRCGHPSAATAPAPVETAHPRAAARPCSSDRPDPVQALGAADIVRVLDTVAAILFQLVRPLFACSPARFTACPVAP